MGDSKLSLEEFKRCVQQLRDKSIWWSAGKRFATCQKCGKVVRLNKPLIGDLHLCSEEVER